MKKISLLSTLKKLPTSLRTAELQNLINEKDKLEAPKWNIALKAIIILFPEEERFNALKLLKDNFDIRLTIPEIEDIKKCLLKDPDFYRLLPYEEKKILTFSTEYTISNSRDISNNNLTQNNNQTHNVNCRKTKLKVSILPVIEEKTEFLSTTQNNSPLLDEKSIRKSKLQDLRLLIITKDLILRYKFFISLKANYQSLANRMNVEEFKNFIEIFPSNDAIKFLNLSFIRDQIEGLQRQNGQLSKESYIDLLNYFKKPYQHDAVMKLLRPISANLDKNGIRHGLFKEKNTLKEQWNLPDIIANCNKRK